MSYVVSYPVRGYFFSHLSARFDAADEAIQYAASLLADGHGSLCVYRHETRKSALEREAVSPASETGS